MSPDCFVTYLPDRSQLYQWFIRMRLLISRRARVTLLVGAGSFILTSSVLSIQDSGILSSIQTSDLGMACRYFPVSR